ncbi:MAG TPA: SCP2 sterol-binding domain-containing protein [Nitrososphaerales archaeon]
MVRFWSKEFFEEASELLNKDQELEKVFSGINTTIIAECSDRNSAFLITVKNGKISSSEARSDDKAEFRFTAPYDKWVKIAQGKDKVQSEVVKGTIKFRGLMPKMLLYLSRIVRMQNKILSIFTSISLEF